jgi:hypothetical protein
MKGRQIMGLFLLEGTLMGVVGAVVGCGLAAMLIGLIGSNGFALPYDMSGMGEVSVLMSGKLYPVLTLPGLISRAIIVVVIAIAAISGVELRAKASQALHLVVSQGHCERFAAKQSHDKRELLRGYGLAMTWL